MSQIFSVLHKYLEMLPRNPVGGGMVPHSAIIWDALLRKQVEKNLYGDMAEIGVYRGFGACLMAGYLGKSERLTLIDLMCGLDYSQEAIREIAGAEVLERITFHLTDSMRLRRAGKLSIGREFRFFHIDGEHSYDAVMSDIGLAADNIAPYGIIVVDDFFSAACPGITHAVFDYVGRSDSNLSVFLIGYNKAYLCFNRWLGFYREVTAHLPEVLEEHGYLTQLAAGGFAFERTYAGISDRATENRYQLIGSYTPDPNAYLSAINQYR
jgi:hypothetical protein